MSSAKSAHLPARARGKTQDILDQILTLDPNPGETPAQFKKRSERLRKRLIAERELEERGRRQLQEVYKHLDHTGPAGNTFIAWYGQLRAREIPHKEAIEQTVAHFHLDTFDWYKRRMESDA